MLEEFNRFVMLTKEQRVLQKESIINIFQLSTLYSENLNVKIVIIRVNPSSLTLCRAYYIYVTLYNLDCCQNHIKFRMADKVNDIANFGSSVDIYREVSLLSLFGRHFF